MPPQQPDRLLDLLEELFDFGAHEFIRSGRDSRPAATM
jgi:hypothetical protein